MGIYDELRVGTSFVGHAHISTVCRQNRSFTAVRDNYIERRDTTRIRNIIWLLLHTSYYSPIVILSVQIHKICVPNANAGVDVLTFFNVKVSNPRDPPHLSRCTHTRLNECTFSLSLKIQGGTRLIETTGMFEFLSRVFTAHVCSSNEPMKSEKILRFGCVLHVAQNDRVKVRVMAIRFPSGSYLFKMVTRFPFTKLNYTHTHTRTRARELLTKRSCLGFVCNVKLYEVGIYTD